MKYIIITSLIFIILGCDNNNKEESCTDNCNYIGEFECKDDYLHVCKTKNGCLNSERLKKCDYGCKNNLECDNIKIECNLTCQENANCTIEDSTPKCICDEGFHKEGDNCIVDNLCLNKNCQENAHCISENNTPICKCNKNSHKDNEDCIFNTQMVACIKGKIPANATHIETKVEVTWNDETNSWNLAKDCEWRCNEGFHEDENSCIDKKKLACNPDNIPDNSIAKDEEVEVIWDNESENWALPKDCNWNCDRTNNYHSNKVNTLCCKLPYDGDNCSDCAEGYQDNNNDNVCNYNCALAKTNSADTCMPKSLFCDDSTGTAICSCRDEITVSINNSSRENAFEILDKSWSRNNLTTATQNCGYQEDWYKFNLNYGEKLISTIDFIDTNNVLQQKLYYNNDENNTTVFHSNDTEPNIERIRYIAQLNKFGTYYLKIAEEQNIYSLNIEKSCNNGFKLREEVCVVADTASCNREMDDITRNYNNSSFDNAYKIDGTKRIGNETEDGLLNTKINKIDGNCTYMNISDWYKIELGVKQYFTFNVVVESGKSELEIYNSNHEILAEIKSPISNSNVTVGSKNGDTFYIRVSDQGRNSLLEYYIDVKIDEHTRDTDFIYSFMKSEKSWEKSRDYCKHLKAKVNEKGYLITVNNQIENDLIKNIGNSHAINNAWIGLHGTGIAPLRTWNWAQNNQELSWSYPWRTTPGYKKCAKIRLDENENNFGKWDNRKCSNERKFICEF